MLLNTKVLFILGVVSLCTWPLAYSLALGKPVSTGLEEKTTEPGDLSSIKSPHHDLLSSVIVPRNPAGKPRIKPASNKIDAPNGLEKVADKKNKNCKRGSLAARATCNNADEEEEDDSDGGNESDVVSEESEGNQPATTEEINEFVIKGAKLLEKLDIKVRAYRSNPAFTSDKQIDKNAFSIENPETSASPNGGYTYEEIPKVEFSDDLKAAFSYLGTDLKTTKFMSSVVRSRGSDGKTELVGNNMFSTPDSPNGILVAGWNKMRGGHNIAPENKKIDQWSNLMYQTMIKRYGAGPTDIPDMKYVLRDEISNGATLSTIVWAHGKIGAGTKKGDKAVFDISSQRPADIEAFRGLIGTPNGKGVVFLLLDHTTPMRGKRIVRIHTWFNEASAEMVLELGV